MIAVFVVISATLYLVTQSDAFSPNVLLIGNAVIFVLSVVSYSISSKFADSASNSQFMRGVLGGTFLKFFLAIIFGLIYIVVNKDDIKVADIVSLMVLYIIYTTIETAFLAKKSRTKTPKMS